MPLKPDKASDTLSPPPGPHSPRYHSFHSGSGARLTGKDILVFCDGSGKDGRAGSETKTNVWKLYELALAQKGTDQKGWGAFQTSTLRQHEIVYLPGVGSGSNRNPYNLLVRLFGSTIVDNIVDAYLHVAKHYEAGSKVYLFGYSRGAFVVRKVASLIYRIGIIREREDMLKLWDRHERPVAWNLIDSTPRGSAIRIQALIVWDTVGAIRSVHPKSKMEADILGMSDAELPPNVDHALHVVAFHENRKLFRVTLFEPDPKQQHKLKEVWFPGAHADVGGGGHVKAGLPSINLIWIIIPPIDRVNFKRIAPYLYHTMNSNIPRKSKACPPLTLIINLLVHETVVYLKNYMPDHLDPRSEHESSMLTVSDLISIGWDIKVSLLARNAFETLKYANAMANRKLKEQAAQYRHRLSSLQMSRAPRPSLTATSQARGPDMSTLQSHRSDTNGDLPPNTTTRTFAVSQVASHRHRAGSYVQVRVQDPVLARTNSQKVKSDTRHTARHDAPLAGIVAFQEFVPRTRGPPPMAPLADRSKFKPKGKDHISRALRNEVLREDGKRGS
ncbi:hypothetical protein RhiXN_03639 [Rhizoctonia solani]|uniref:T6SS Phospholipase effector Tle1-like catalytic domain-containing protein n=1 Tax=Rhizoctonia solani TaxID=456999 RepID=A0A8H8NNS0_9AGAM|nr:uncharacterized protein RhiXN_03639 [Rhizoctonia solani]QRW15638.1 hypothetical protein RhiXN_03639 [Rhizoctonia solani]